MCRGLSCGQLCGGETGCQAGAEVFETERGRRAPNCFRVPMLGLTVVWVRGQKEGTARRTPSCPAERRLTLQRVGRAGGHGLCGAGRPGGCGEL